jgi:hypothetical protein
MRRSFGLAEALGVPIRKSSFSGAYHAFGYSKYAEHYLGAVAHRFNRHFDLHALPGQLLSAAVSCGPCPQRQIRVAEIPDS